MEDLWGTRRGSRAAPSGSSGSPRRRRSVRRKAQRSGLDALMADLVALEAPRPEPEVGIDPVDRALLVQLYRELVGTVEGPVVPFPVELMEDPALVRDRAVPAALLDLRAFRDRRRAAVPSEPRPSG